jgi:glutathione peroxidase
VAAAVAQAKGGVFSRKSRNWELAMWWIRLVLSLVVVLVVAPARAQDCANTDINFTVKRLLGKPENLCDTHHGKVILVVNTASHCGYTGQYAGLEALYQRYQQRGLVVLGFPSDEFGQQEFADEAEIQKFCKANFGVSFPMYAKASVKGPTAIPLFQVLAQKTGKAPSWNFNKYLLGRDGRVLRHFDSNITPEHAHLVGLIEAALAKP